MSKCSATDRRFSRLFGVSLVGVQGFVGFRDVRFKLAYDIAGGWVYDVLWKRSSDPSTWRPF